ncbi:MAG: biotin/lipoyl-containing protein, partial [Polyangiales bacterium]
MSESFEVSAPMKALVVNVRAKVGQKVAAGETLVILEAMKMEHIVAAERGGIVTDVLAGVD